MKSEDTHFASNIEESVFINPSSIAFSQVQSAVEESPKPPVEAEIAQQSVIPSEINDQKKIKTDQVVKKIWRLFRHLVKENFQKVFGKKYYHWIERTKRQKTLAFFTERQELKRGHVDYQVSLDFYKRNEEVFYKLVHNTSFEDGDPVSQNFQKVFGNHPNKKNIKEFF